MRIMQALQTNLDGKSKQYKDPALTHLFLMNNIHYMVRSVRRFVSRLLYFQTSFWNVISLSSMQITDGAFDVLFSGLKPKIY